MNDTKTIHPEIEKLRALAMRSHDNISHYPEKQGERILNDYSQELTEDLETIKKHEADQEHYTIKYCSFLSAWLYSKSNCISSFITGSSNFPVRRAEKANRAEQNKYEAWREWREKVLHKITKPENTDIVKGSDGAINKMQAKLKKLETMQETMKAINKIIRRKAGTKEEKIKEIAEQYPYIKDPASLFVPNWNGIGFAHYSLTNNNANINRLRKDIEGEKIRAEQYQGGNREYQINGIDVLENVEENRIQILFEDKPSEEVRTKLKSNGFRWAPRFNAWQRQLTRNAVQATKYVLQDS